MGDHKGMAAEGRASSRGYCRLSALMLDRGGPCWMASLPACRHCTGKRGADYNDDGFFVALRHGIVRYVIERYVVRCWSIARCWRATPCRTSWISPISQARILPTLWPIRVCQHFRTTEGPGNLLQHRPAQYRLQ